MSAPPHRVVHTKLIKAADHIAELRHLVGHSWCLAEHVKSASTLCGRAVRLSPSATSLAGRFSSTSAKTSATRLRVGPAEPRLADDTRTTTPPSVH